MGLLEQYERLEQVCGKFKRFLFPKRIYPSERVMHLLKVIYPSLDFSKINFYEGLPWFTKYVAPYVTAQALPHTYSLRRLNIHIERYDESSCNILADIVHEAYHMVQYERFWKARGLGFLRPFIVYYNACYLTRGYRNNPFEIPAYEQEYAFLRFCNDHKIKLGSPQDRETLEHLVDQTLLRTHFIEFKYEGKFIHLFLALIFTLLVAIVKPVAELLLLINYGIMRTTAYMLKGLYLLLGRSGKAF